MEQNSIDTIKNTISHFPKEKMTIRITPARPAEKSHEIYSLEIDGKKWFCERPRYHFSRLDESLWTPAFFNEGKILFDSDDVLSVFDHTGLPWVREELGSQSLLQYYLKHPERYVSAMTNHHSDVSHVLALVERIHQTLDNTSELGANLDRLYQAYNLFYRYPSSLFYLFDELIYHFKQLLLKYLDKKTVNIYFTQFLSAEMTKEVIEKGHGRNLIISRPQSRGVLYAAGTEPVVFYRRPKFFHEFSNDMEMIEALQSRGITAEDMKQFLACRWIVPIAVQTNEEAQYLESQILSSHASYILGKMSRILNKSLDELEQMSYQDIQACIDKSATGAAMVAKSILRGIPASPGRVEGKVKIVLPGAPLNLEDGDILVTTITDPTMIQVILKAAAIITDIGGVTSHPAIISREMGIPCVVNTKEATSKLVNGMRVLVDGEKGEVYALD